MDGDSMRVRDGALFTGLLLVVGLFFYLNLRYGQFAVEARLDRIDKALGIEQESTDGEAR